MPSHSDQTDDESDLEEPPPPCLHDKQSKENENRIKTRGFIGGTGVSKEMGHYNLKERK